VTPFPLPAAHPVDFGSGVAEIVINFPSLPAYMSHTSEMKWKSK